MTYGIWNWERPYMPGCHQQQGGYQVGWEFEGWAEFSWSERAMVASWEVVGRHGMKLTWTVWKFGKRNRKGWVCKDRVGRDFGAFECRVQVLSKGRGESGEAYEQRSDMTNSRFGESILLAANSMGWRRRSRRRPLSYPGERRSEWGDRLLREEVVWWRARQRNDAHLCIAFSTIPGLR